MNIDTHSIHSILKNNNVQIINEHKIVSQKISKPVIMLSLANEELQTFPSLAEAARYLIENKLTGCCFTTIRHHLSEVCNGKEKLRQNSNGSLLIRNIRRKKNET